jgi:FeS assembly SUF system protein
MTEGNTMDNKPGRMPLEIAGQKHAVANGGGPTAPPEPPVSTPSAPAAGPADIGELQERIVAVLRTCFDPEIPVNIHELGLIYGIDVQESGDVGIRMTLTSPACPVAGSLPPEVQAKIGAIPGVKSAKVELVWDPPWTPDRMSEAAKLELGMF